MERNNFVYILKCADNTLYTGWTNDLKKRLANHNRGTASKYTRVRLPVKLVYYESFEDSSSARKRECAIKKLRRSEKLSLMGKSDMNDIPELEI